MGVIKPEKRSIGLLDNRQRNRASRGILFEDSKTRGAGRPGRQAPRPESRFDKEVDRALSKLTEAGERAITGLAMEKERTKSFPPRDRGTVTAVERRWEQKAKAWDAKWIEPSRAPLGGWRQALQRLRYPYGRLPYSKHYVLPRSALGRKPTRSEEQI